MIQSEAHILLPDFLEKASGRKTILLVEDEAIIALSESQRLEKCGFRVLTAYSAKEATDLALNDYSINLILMDIDLRGEEDGTQAALKILQVRDIPIVFLSSHTEPEVVAKTEKITSYGYVVKDSGENVLLASIKMAFQLYESHLRLKRSEESLKENQELLEATLRSIGDGVISTDELGNITNMNYVAESLTGWNLHDAIGEPIEKVFKIFNTRTGRRLRNPIDAARPSKRLIGLDRETLLYSKNGQEYFISDTSAPIRSERGFVVGSVLVFRDITKEQRLLRNIRESETRFRRVANAAPVMIWMAGLDKKCDWFNQTWLEFTGRSMQEEMGDGWAEGVHPEDFEECIQIYHEHFEARLPFQMSYRLRNRKGEWRWIQDNGLPIQDESGVFTGFIGSCVDITEVKLAVETLSQDLEERESLFKELQHRVKNSINMIASIVEISGNKSKNEEVETTLDSIVNRIHSIGSLYDQLYTSGSSNRIRLDEYIEKIISTLFKAFLVDPERILLRQRLEFLKIEAKSAVPIGLIVNELITNILKYGFPSDQTGSVYADLYKENGIIYLSIWDDGLPFPEGFHPDSSEGSGLQLVQLLVQQLKGTIQWNRKEGKKLSIRFPAKNHEID
ncbi:PAS domain S-box protein [Leptospira wolffii]|uniref:histidine kinase n=1 Tax=Leptospira wolffii TaxID=409998 RepID=A0ABV5BKZ4_9LEPT